MPLKEKPKKYIQNNYGNFSIVEVAKKFGCSAREVEDYLLEELEPKTILQEKKAYFEEEKKNSSALKYFLSNKIVIGLLILCLIALVFGINTAQVSNNDIWMHMKNGELILKNKHFLYKDTYSFRTIGMDWVNHEWLAGVIFYLVYQVAHVNALIFFKGFLVLVFSLFMVATCRLTKNRWAILYPLVVFALFNAGVRFLVRPHMFTYFFVPIFIYILFAFKYQKKDYLYWLPILSLLWVNIHGGFVVGMGIITLFTFFEIFRTFLNRYFSFIQNDILSFQRLKKLVIIWFFSGLVLSLNPHGISIYTYPFELISQKTFMSQIYEWQPPFKSDTFKKSYAFNYFLIWMALLGLSFMLDYKHLDLTNLALSGLFLAMSLKMHRNIAIFALATAPILSLNLDLFFDRLLNKKGTGGIDLLMKLAVLLITIGLTRMSFKYGYIYRSGSRKPFGLGVASNMPIEAVQYVKKNNIKGNSFNPYTYGTYIIHHLYPDTRVVMDSRDLPYGEKLYLEHQYAMNSVKHFKALFQKYHVDYILMNYRHGQHLKKHFEYLEKTGEWVLVYFDDRNVVYIRNIPENKKLINRDGYLVMHPVLTFERGGVEGKNIPRCIKECQRAIKETPHFLLPRIVLQNIYLAQKDYQKAVEQGKKIIEIEPRNYRYQRLLARSYQKIGKLEKALEHGKITISLSPKDPVGYIFLGDVYQQMGEKDQSRAYYLKALEIKPDAGPYIRKKLKALT